MSAFAAAIATSGYTRRRDLLRITTQLIRVADGYHLWSVTYDRKMNDIFIVQDEIARHSLSDGGSLLRHRLAAIPLLVYIHRQGLHEFLGVRQIALCGREVNARSFHAVTGYDGVEDGFLFCGFQFSLHWDFD